jgi:hypothetical protein
MSKDHPIVVLLGLLSTVISIIVGSISIYQFITGNTHLSLSPISLPELHLPKFSVESLDFTSTPLDWLIFVGKIVFWVFIAVVVIKLRWEILELFRLIIYFVIFLVLVPTSIGLAIISVFTYLGSLLGVPEVGLAVGLIAVISVAVFFLKIIKG